MVDIPLELSESLKKGECVLFVGAGLSEGLPTWKELMEPLAEELGLNPDEAKNKDPRIIASWYENKFERSKLEEKIVSRLKKDVPLTKTHEIISKIPLKAIVTTNYDHLLEKAFCSHCPSDLWLFVLASKGLLLRFVLFPEDAEQLIEDIKKALDVDRED